MPLPNIPDITTIPTWIILVGQGIGVSFAAFFAAKAKDSNKKIQTELDGPGDEPSLRQLVRASTNQAMDLYDRLHKDHEGLRAETMERMKKLEDADSTQGLLVTVVKSLESQVTNLVNLSNRHGLNLHHLANKVQVRLLTQEEAEEIMRKRAEEELKVKQAQTKKG